MSYQVIARKWRPQTFADVIGQQAVTRTLRNALSSGRLAQAFVFAGPRGVGKTTTARILARALSCANGPTAEPCGVCDACVEIAEGRDIDVLEIDAATHTGVDNVREVIISGLSIRPVRNRYKIFIIDEVHQLSTPSFNALLKSIEEPPPHVVFMMATTELDKIPETVLSRSQVYEFRTISSKAIADQLRRIVDAEHIVVDEPALTLIARDADGSMRDAQSKLDQVIAFTGSTITLDDVSMVLGLVGRELLFDVLEAVADERAPAAFDLAGRAVEMGYDLRAVCRELSRVVRDLLVLSVDPSRISDPEIAGESERDRLKALVARFSREDLLRAFDLLTRAESDIRGAAQPRYHLEMALLRWIHLRKLMPIEDLILGAGSVPAASPGGGASRSLPQAAPVSTRPAVSSGAASRTSTPAPSRTASAASAGPSSAAPSASGVSPAGPSRAAAESSSAPAPATRSGGGDANFKDGLLAEVRRGKPAFYNMVVAQAQSIVIDGDRMTFTFSANQRTLRDAFEQNRPWLEGLAQQVAGRKITVAGVQAQAGAPPAPVDEPAPRSVPSAPAASARTPEAEARDAQPPAAPSAEGRGGAADPGDQARKTKLRTQALADAGVQALLEVFPAEIRDVEEM